MSKPQPSVTKRQREQAKRERKQIKAEKRANRVTTGPDDMIDTEVVYETPMPPEANEPT